MLEGKDPFTVGPGVGGGGQEWEGGRDSAVSSQQLVGAKRSTVKPLSPSPAPHRPNYSSKPFLLSSRASPCQLPAPPGVSCTLCLLAG